jgi:hypothetical protein
LTFFKKIIGNTRPTTNEQNQHMMLAYAVFGFFAPGQSLNADFHPSLFYFTPESRNAHWSFAVEDSSWLGWYLGYAYRQPGPYIQIHDPIDDEHISYLVNNDIESFFRSKPSSIEGGSPEKPTVEPESDFSWQGHFFWQEQGQGRAYGFEIAGTPVAKRYGQIAIRFVVVSQVNQTPSAFFEELCRVLKNPISNGDIPLTEYIDLEKPRIVDRVTGGDPSALRRYATAWKNSLAQS